MSREHEQPPSREVGIPEPLPVNFDNIPEILQECDQWVDWHYQLVEDEIKKASH